MPYVFFCKENTFDKELDISFRRANRTPHPYLYYAVGPALSDPVPGPNVVPVLCQFLHQLVLVGCQFDVVEVQRGGLVCVHHHIATQDR